jgi:hypothetical protein
MKYAIAAALALLVVTAVSGTEVAVMRSTDVALLIWIAGGSPPQASCSWLLG